MTIEKNKRREIVINIYEQKWWSQKEVTKYVIRKNEYVSGKKKFAPFFSFDLWKGIPGKLLKYVLNYIQSDSTCNQFILRAIQRQQSFFKRNLINNSNIVIISSSLCQRHERANCLFE